MRDGLLRDKRSPCFIDHTCQQARRVEPLLHRANTRENDPGGVGEKSSSLLFRITRALNIGAGVLETATYRTRTENFKRLGASLNGGLPIPGAYK